MPDVVAALESALGERVRTDAGTRAAHSRDSWVLSELDDLEGRPPAPPRAVVLAESTGDVARTLVITREAGVPVVEVEESVVLLRGRRHKRILQKGIYFISYFITFLLFHFRFCCFKFLF